MAALGCLCQPWSLLFGWYSGSCCFGFPIAWRRKRPLDWYTVRIDNTDCPPCADNMLHKLATSGMFFAVAYELASTYMSCNFFDLDDEEQ